MILEMLFKLLVGHAVADFALQSDFIARMKSRWNDQSGTGMWIYVSISHALVHGGAVYLATVTRRKADDVVFIAETGAHWLIDYGKCANMISLHTDQFMHVLCKCLWIYLLLNYF